MVPHQMDQPQPTKQKSTQNNWAMATIMLMMSEPRRALALSYCEKRGIPMQIQKNPEKRVPSPGITTLQKVQNQARDKGSTGIAPRILELGSTKSMCRRRRAFSWLGCLMLDRRASAACTFCLRRQHRTLQNRRKQPLEANVNLRINLRVNRLED